MPHLRSAIAKHSHCSLQSCAPLSPLPSPLSPLSLQMFYFAQGAAARHFGLGLTRFKTKIRDLGIEYWPHRWGGQGQGCACTLLLIFVRAHVLIVSAHSACFAEASYCAQQECGCCGWPQVAMLLLLLLCCRTPSAAAAAAALIDINAAAVPAPPPVVASPGSLTRSSSP